MVLSGALSVDSVVDLTVDFCVGLTVDLSVGLTVALSRALSVDSAVDLSVGLSVALAVDSSVDLSIGSAVDSAVRSAPALAIDVSRSTALPSWSNKAKSEIPELNGYLVWFDCFYCELNMVACAVNTPGERAHVGEHRSQNRRQFFRQVRAYLSCRVWGSASVSVGVRFQWAELRNRVRKKVLVGLTQFAAAEQ